VPTSLLEGGSGRRHKEINSRAISKGVGRRGEASGKKTHCNGTTGEYNNGHGRKSEKTPPTNERSGGKKGGLGTWTGSDLIPVVRF